MNDPLTKKIMTVGWREWASFPSLNLPAIKAKIDTGAKTSSLHAFNIKPFVRNDHKMVSFQIHPIPKNSDVIIDCEAELVDQRVVTSSGGQKELRYVIKTNLQLADVQWPIEITLTNRETMRFRMLIGRHALRDRIIVDPSKSYLNGKLDIHALYTQNTAMRS